MRTDAGVSLLDCLYLLMFPFSTEWGLVIDDKDATTQIMDAFWNPLWRVSYRKEDCDVQAVMDGLEIDRDGEDPHHISPETKALIDSAEQKAPHALEAAGGAGSIVSNRVSNRNLYFQSDDRGDEKKEMASSDEREVEQKELASSVVREVEQNMYFQ